MLKVRDLSVAFNMYDVGLVQRHLLVISGLDLTVDAGELVAVVGSSGSGKSLLAHAILGILPGNAEVTGEMLFKGEPLTPERQAKLRGKEMALIPQSVSFLDPLMRVGPQVSRAARLSGVGAAECGRVVAGAFNRYGLNESVGRAFPFELSGGMARRVLTATATVGKADLLIADEPTPGLHPEMVHETLRHLRELAGEGKGVILITHDIDAALEVADRVAIFYGGSTLEIAPAADFGDGADALRHPYSRALWQALPRNGLVPVPGTQPSPESMPTGCVYADRCPMTDDECRHGRPELRQVGGGLVRCRHA